MTSNANRLVVCALAIGFCSNALFAEDAQPAGTKTATETHDSPGCAPKEKDPRRHDQFMKDKEALLKKGPIDLVFIGDSITDGWRGGPQHAEFETAFGKYNPYNIGISGDQTQHVLWRIEHGELDGLHPKAVEIMIGTNNLGNSRQTPQQTIDGVKCVVEAVHKKLPEAKILLLGVFPRGREANDPYRAQIKQVNDALAKLDGADNVNFMDIGDKFLDDKGLLAKEIMPDALHPNQKGYTIWTQAIKPAVDEMEKQ